MTPSWRGEPTRGGAATYCKKGRPPQGRKRESRRSLGRDREHLRAGSARISTRRGTGEQVHLPGEWEGDRPSQWDLSNAIRPPHPIRRAIHRASFDVEGNQAVDDQIPRPIFHGQHDVDVGRRPDHLEIRLRGGDKEDLRRGARVPSTAGAQGQQGKQENRESSGRNESDAHEATPW